MRKLTGDFEGGISSLALSADERWLAANQVRAVGGKKLKQPIRLWDLHDLNRPAERIAGNEPDNLAFSPDGHFLAYTGASGVYLQPFSGKNRPTLALPNTYIHSFMFVPNTTMLLAAGNGPFGWDVKAEKPVAVSLEGLDCVTKDVQGRLSALLLTLVMRQDGAAVAALVRENNFDPRNEDVFESVVTIQCWRYPACSNRVKSTTPIAVDPIFGKPELRQLTFSPDGRFLAGLRSHDIVVFDAETLSEIATLTPSGFRDPFRQKEPSVVCLAFTKDGKRLAAGCQGRATEANISFWSTATWKKDPDLKCACGRVQVLAFTNSGRLIAVADYIPAVWEPGEY